MQGDPVYLLVVYGIPIVLAITLHEAAHGLVAYRLGDDTARKRGRVTLNPVRHVDPVGTLLLPGFMLLSTLPFVFGWARPVPVNPRRLHRPVRDMAIVAIAGPATNLALALVSAILLRFTTPLPDTPERWLSDALGVSVWINVILTVLNMLPLPPLDGGRVAMGILPPALGQRLARLERYGLFILVGILFVVPMAGRLVGLDLNIFAMLVLEPASWLRVAIGYLTGLI